MIAFILNTPWVFGLIVVSGIAGAIGSFVIFVIFRHAIGATSESVLSREFFYTGIMTGIVERSFFTLLIGLLGSNGVAQAAIAWIAIKGQVHYKMFSEGGIETSRAYLGLLGSIASLVFAIAGGYLWQESWTAQRLCDWLSVNF